jgi:hypothetical protein
MHLTGAWQIVLIRWYNYKNFMGLTTRCYHDFSAHYQNFRSLKKTYKVIGNFIGCFDGITAQQPTRDGIIVGSSEI